MSFGEIQNVLLADAVNVIAIAMGPARPLKTIGKPILRNPLLKFLMVLPQAQFKVADCVAFRHTPRMAPSFDFHHHGCFSTLQTFRNRGCRNLAE